MSRKISYPLILFILLALHAANPLSVTAHQPVEVNSSKVPNGLNAAQWQSIQQQMQFGIAPREGLPDTYATHAGQWQVRFDPSGVTMTDAANGLDWKMSLMPSPQLHPSPLTPLPKGEGNHDSLSPRGNLPDSLSPWERAGVRVRDAVRVEAHDATLTYYHNANLQKRFDNSAAGLKQTFILQQRVDGRQQKVDASTSYLLPSTTPLRLALHLSTSLTPRLQDDQTLLLQNEDG